MKKEQLNWNEETNQTALVTVNDDGSITFEPITSEEASEWEARKGY